MHEYLKQKTMESLIKIIQDPAAANIAAATADSVGPINTLKILGSAAIGGQQLLKEATKLLFTQDNESIGAFAGYAIGEAGTGQVIELSQTEFEYPQSLFALQGIYNEGIRPNPGNQIAIKIFEMKGIEGNAQIGISYEVNHGTAIANGRVWLTLGFKNIKAETTNEIISAIKPLGGAFDATFSLEMETIQVDDTTMVMGPTDGFGGVTPVFEIKTNEGNIKSVQFIPFFTDTLSSGPIEAPHIISRHLRKKRELNEEQTEALVESPLPEGKVTEIAKGLEGTDYRVKWNNDNTAIVIAYTNPENESEVSEVQGIVLKENEIEITLDGGGVAVITKNDLGKNITLGQDKKLRFVDEANKNVFYRYDLEEKKWKGFAELDLIDGSKLEVMACSNKQIVMDHIGNDALWFKGNRAAIEINYPDLKVIRKEMFKTRDVMLNLIPKNGSGFYPPYPEDENPSFIYLFIYDIGKDGVIFLYPNKNGDPAIIYYNDPNIAAERSILRSFIVNDWKFEASN